MQNHDSNLFDGQWELGSLNLTTGEKANSGNDIRSKNFVKVKPGSRVGFTRTDTTSLYMLTVAYKQDKSFSRYMGAKSSMPAYYIMNADEYYIMFYLYNRITPLENLKIELT